MSVVLVSLVGYDQTIDSVVLPPYGQQTRDGSTVTSDMTAAIGLRRLQATVVVEALNDLTGESVVEVIDDTLGSDDWQGGGGTGGDGSFTVATQAETLAGTNNVKGITPLRLQQKFDVTPPPNASVTLAKMANLAQDQVIGRVTGSTGVPETFTVTAAARTVLDDTTVDAMLATLGGASASGTGGVARVNSPTFTGAPAAPTATAGTNTTQIATTAFVKAAMDALLGGAPGALDTLDELAAALADDANFAATVTAALAGKAPLASPALTGTPTAPTAAEGANTTQIATTAFVKRAVDAVESGGGSSGNVTVESVSTTTYTFVSGDAGKVKVFTHASGCTATVPTGLGDGWNVSATRGAGAGVTTFAEGAGASLESANGEMTLDEVGALVSIVPRGTDDYLLKGELGSFAESVESVVDEMDLPSTTQVGGVSITVAGDVANGTYWAAVPDGITLTFTSMSGRSSAGTGTVTAITESGNMTGTPLSASSTRSAQNITAANVVVGPADVGITVSSASSLANLRVAMKATRTLAS